MRSVLSLHAPFLQMAPTYLSTHYLFYSLSYGLSINFRVCTKSDPHPFWSVLIFFFFASKIYAQFVYLEKDGLVAMEAEAATIPSVWKVETTDPDYRGDGYIRYDGANFYNEPNENFIIALPVSDY